MNPIGFFFKSLFQTIDRALKKVLRNPIVRVILQIVGCALGGLIVSAGITAATGGSIGDILQAAAFYFFVPQIWDAVGTAINGISQIGQALIHGVVNGAITAARGGNFLAGFATGVTGKVTGFASDILSQGNKLIDTAIVAASGCAGAIIAKGSCANGAITAAFANMYNKWGKVLDSVEMGLAGAGLIPGLGNVADVLGAGVAFARGDYAGAALSLASAIPGAGQGAGVLKLRRLAGRGCSFHGNTEVATDKGFVKIRKIRPDEHKVWARDEHTGKMKFQTVLDAYSNPYKETVYIAIRDVKTGEQQTIVSNKIHAFYVSTGATLMKLVSNGGFVTEGTNETGEWIKAAELQAGHRLLNAGKGKDSESWSEVISIKIAKENLRAYNLHVDKFHTFYVRGADNDNAKAVWVHNNCGFGSLSEAKNLVKQWQKDPVTGLRKDNIRYHFKEHGDGKTLPQYLRSAEQFAKEVKGRGKLVDGLTSNVMRNKKGGRYIDRNSNGEIVSYGRK